MLYIEDEASVNGVLVNGTIVRQPTELHHGDVLDIGGCRLLLELTDNPNNWTDPEHAAFLDAPTSVERNISIEGSAIGSATRDKHFVRVEVKRPPKVQSSPPTRSLAVARARQAMKRRSRHTARMTFVAVLLGLGVIGTATTVMFMRIAVSSPQSPPAAAYDSFFAGPVANPRNNAAIRNETRSIVAPDSKSAPTTTIKTLDVSAMHCNTPVAVR